MTETSPPTVVPMAAPMGSWKSPLDADTVAAGAVNYHEIQSLGAQLYWLESRPQEGGRVTLVRDGESILPLGFSARSRVHEYGGGSYLACADGVFFVNFEDQEIYALDEAPRQITRSGNAERYADFCHVPGSALAICVCERQADGEVSNLLVAIDLNHGQVTTLHEGHDFYAAPRLNAGKLAFIAWDHPNMPWHATLLYVADFEYETPHLVSPRVVAGGDGASIGEPHWGEERLFYLSDAHGWWNVHVFDALGSRCLHEVGDEFGAPAWVFAAHTYAVVNDDLVIARRIRQGVESLVMITGDGHLSEWHALAGSYDSLHWHALGQRLLCVTGAPDRSSRIEALGESGQLKVVAGASVRSRHERGYSSLPEMISFDSDGEAHALFYPPTNADFRGMDGERPPLLLTTHGGPTAMADRSRQLRIQYYTSRGWAVADLNYAGSTGFGSAYRRKLDGQWGVADVRDCEALVRHLVASNVIDPKRCAIRGGSAGGYTTLAALTFSTAFQAGASAYGISDLEAFAKDTHKFESHYLDSLVGPWPEAADTYRARSPVHHTHRLACPMIFFQGGKDLVVPPNQSQMMVDALDAKGISHAYVFYPDEGHEFRDAHNIAHALRAEYQFFCRVFAIIPADAPIDFDIRHL